MKFSFKQKVLAAAVAMTCAGAANAAIQSQELILFLSNGSTNSATFDLGVAFSQLTPSFNGTVTWNLATGGVSGTPGSTSLSYGNVWSGAAFSATTQWGVFGIDTTASDLANTSLDSQALIGSSDSDANVDAAAQAVQTNYVNLLNNAGSHASAANGAFLSTGGLELHQNGFGDQGRYRLNTPYTINQIGDGSMSFYKVAYNLAGGPAVVTKYPGSFSLNAAAGTLTYSVAAVPEPSTYVLLGAGLIMVGAIARRRINA